MIRRLGFNEIWISRVMACVTTVSYAILVNGESGPIFIPTRGLRQGDSIFSYLYLICMEALNSLLNEAKLSNKIKWVKVARDSHSINYIFFVDDNIVFCKAKTSDWQNIKEVLDIYEVVTSQGINKLKSGIFFSSNTNRTVRWQILTLAGVLLCNNQEQYLELPMMVGGNRYRAFEIIKDKVWHRINN